MTGDVVRSERAEPQRVISQPACATVAHRAYGLLPVCCSHPKKKLCAVELWKCTSRATETVPQVHPSLFVMHAVTSFQLPCTILSKGNIQISVQGGTILGTPSTRDNQLQPGSGAAPHCEFRLSSRLLSHSAPNLLSPPRRNVNVTALIAATYLFQALRRAAQGAVVWRSE